MELTVLMYLIPSLIMFGCGVYGFVTRKNMIAILISLELMLNSVDINFVVTVSCSPASWKVCSLRCSPLPLRQPRRLWLLPSSSTYIAR